MATITHDHAKPCDCGTGDRCPESRSAPKPSEVTAQATTAAGRYRPGSMTLGDRVQTPERIGAIPAGTTGTVVEVAKQRVGPGGVLFPAADMSEWRYTVGWDVQPRRWTSDLSSRTLVWATTSAIG